MLSRNTLTTNPTPWVVLAFALFWFIGLGFVDLVEPDEGRYAEIPREMVSTGDWLIPRLNGFKYFEKPPLQYWLTAMGYELFGTNNASARLVVAVLGFLGALWTGFVGWRLFGRETGWFAFLVSLNSLLYFTMGHLLTLDMSVSFFMSLGMGALFLAQTQRSKPNLVRNWMLFGWAALALAVLVKGLMGVALPAMAVVFYTLWSRDWALWRHLHIGKGLLLFLAITAPWFIVVSLKDPEFLRFFFIHEHLERFLTTTHSREGAWWYFIPILLVGGLPWIWRIVQVVVKPAFQFNKFNQRGFSPLHFLWLYVVGIFVFFSVSHSKLPPYILPIMPALALLVGRQLSRVQTIRGELVSLGLWLLVLLGAIYHVPRVTDGVEPAAMLAYRNWLIVAAAICATGLLLVYLLRHRHLPAITMAGFSALLSFQVAWWGFQTQTPFRSSHEMAKAITPHLKPGSEIYSVGYYPQSLPFYLNRTIHLVMDKGELAMGIRLEPERYIPDASSFVQRWQSEQHPIAVFTTAFFDKRFRPHHKELAMQEIYRDVLRVVVAKP